MVGSAAIIDPAWIAVIISFMVLLAAVGGAIVAREWTLRQNTNEIKNLKDQIVKIEVDLTALDTRYTHNFKRAGQVHVDEVLKPIWVLQGRVDQLKERVDKLERK